MPGCEHENVAAERLVDHGSLVEGADGDRVASESLRLAAEHGETESVAVALGDRHDRGELLGERLSVGAPRRCLDVQREHD